MVFLQMTSPILVLQKNNLKFKSKHPEKISKKENCCEYAFLLLEVLLADFPILFRFLGLTNLFLLNVVIIQVFLQITHFDEIHALEMESRLNLLCLLFEVR